MSKRGRKVKVFPQGEVDFIIYNFTNEYSPGLLKYLDVYKYSLKLFEIGTIGNKYSEDFWRKPGRQGKESIDKVNLLYLKSVENENNENNRVVNTEQIINKLLVGVDKTVKRNLINELKINEQQAKRVSSTISKASYFEEENEKLKKEIDTLTERLKTYQKIIFSWTAASHASNDILFNLTKGSFNESPILQYSYNNLFTDQEDIVNFLELYLKNFLNKIGLENNKIVNLKDSRIKLLLESDKIDRESEG